LSADRDTDWELGRGLLLVAVIVVAAQGYAAMERDGGEEGEMHEAAIDY